MSDAPTDSRAAEGEGLSDLLAPEADGVFAALADRTRRRILVRLADRPDDAGAVAADLGISRQAVAKHLRILVDSGLVIASPQQRRQVHAVRPDRIREISDLLGAVSRGWDRRLALVKEHAEHAEHAERAEPAE
ncbi:MULTISPECIES: ArsR/SmtB family transcription factor [unclassified Dietzia]|uniref:ArsR/SmtB family transcription factor n=1 Tax=unclassified Dietzia TaxID=2617939 RepID=UPI0020B138A8|nr:MULTISPECIES: metalloregulator ArsR/SmtB family transcription factor [unclassified Dietzia]MDV3356998.1 metalloregulator ArsR/SmtB family transcription factor [Dietzia sp. IN118]